ncbi:hypothetical protein ACFQLX_22860 [Streptomyces polyrhachis]|uniref:Carboxymuconolactone decarboxylase-like domain-containing protein n=1 Tax=Streptomyces polyrhachis TaxID=1282885 RepID=A0ABW2GJQ0_9ACTN
MSVARAVRAVLRPLSLAQIRHVRPVPPRSAPPRVARVYRALEGEFGLLAPPVALHAPSPDVLAASWVLLREAMVVPGRAPAAAKEAVAVAVSEHNACPFCVVVHSAMLDSLAPARRSPATDSHGATDRRAAGDWARAGLLRPGTAHPAPVLPPLPDLAYEAELTAVAVLLHYLNRMAQVFLGPLPMPPGVPAPALGAVMPVLTWLRRDAERRVGAPGESLTLLAPGPAAPPAWTDVTPEHLAAACGRVAAVMEAAGERSVAAPVRALVERALREWDGRAPGPGRGWTRPLLAGTDPAQRPAAQLALLVALAPYQVGPSVIAEFRTGGATDAHLVDLAAWASMAAAREAGGRLRPAPLAAREREPASRPV